MLLGLLALLLIGWLLISLLNGDDATDKVGGGSADTGSLSVSGTAVLPVPAGGMTEFDGQPATGKGLEVVSVNGNEGFSVAKGEGDPVYVEWGGDVGTNEASTFHPKVGDKVNLTGPVQTADPAVIERLKLDPADAQRVESQGAFVNADRVVESK